MRTNLGQYRDRVDRALADLTEKRIVNRIWAHDHTVWKPDPGEITNRLGWLHTPDSMSDKIGSMQRLVEDVRNDGYTHALVLGMGGSSMAPEVFRKVYGVKRGFLDLAVLDTTDPRSVSNHSERLDMKRTLFIVSTKSGGTVETLSFFKFFYSKVVDIVGSEQAGAHFIAITDPGSNLEKLAQGHKFRTAFLNDPNIGGRYSALSFFGMVPACLIGADVETLLDRAWAEMMNCEICSEQMAERNRGVLLGAILGELAKAGRDKLTLFGSPLLISFGDWVEQLIAESTGKEGRGILPIVNESVGPPNVYGDDRLFVYLRLECEDPEGAAVQALENAGHPVVHMVLKERYDLGGQFFLWEMATAVAGQRLGINPFDQPDVETAKVSARKIMAEHADGGMLPDGGSVVPTKRALDEFLSQAAPGDYVAFQAYLEPTTETDAALLELRTKIRDRLKLATTVGYGPRFLHSTGQLHKGDSGNGFFIQFTDDMTRDVQIPEKTGAQGSTITFGVLKTAQALGDQQALLDAGRRVIRFHLGSDSENGLKKLI